MISDRLKANLKTELRGSLLAKLGIGILLLILLMALFAPLLAPHHPSQQGFTDDRGQNLPPVGLTYDTTIAVDGEFTSYTVSADSDHLLGTNPLGQDVLSRFIYGARVSLLVGVSGTLLALLIGVPIGLVAGYYRGRVDDGLMRMADTMLAFPALILALALIGAFGEATLPLPDPIVLAGFADGMPETTPFPIAVTVVVALVTWVWFARVARGEAMSITNQEYIKAARAMGASDMKILLKHILPNSLTPIIVLATIQVAAIILLESSLSFLGFSGTDLSWGFEIQRGQDQLRREWWISTVPGIGIVLAVISVNLIGDWLRDALDPNISGERGG